MKKVIKYLFAILSIGFAPLAFSAEPKQVPAEASLQSIALIDVASSSFVESKNRIVTDFLRTELFKTRLFRIVERGLIQKTIADLKFSTWNGDDLQILQLGKALSVDKVMTCGIEKFGDSLACTLKIVDVKASLVDYTDNTFVKGEDQIFEALKSLTSKALTYYRTVDSLRNVMQQSPDDQSAKLKAAWSFLGAKDSDLEYLVSKEIKTDDFLSIRQYDVNFLADDYVRLLRSSLDIVIVKNFLQAGMSFAQTEKALRLGITKLDRYREVFAPEGLNYAQYLEAYENGFLTPQEYLHYRSGFKNDFLTFGVGGIANDYPITNAEFKFALGQIGWERFWTNNLRQPFKFSTNVGLYLMYMAIPVPYVDMNAYFGMPPFYFMMGLSEHAELLIGGHMGTAFKLGVEVLEKYQLYLMYVPFGTQPAVSYGDLKTKRGNPGYWEIKFPYVGLVFEYKY